MRLDIRLPIGWLFTILGLLLAGWGLISDPRIYERSLGINVNLGWGIVLLTFGATMLGFGYRAQANARRAPPPAPDGTA